MPLTLRSALKADETYAGVDTDIDELLAQGRCVRIPVNDPKKRELQTVLLGMPAGRPVSEEVRELWRNELLLLSSPPQLSSPLRSSAHLTSRPHCDDVALVMTWHL